MSVDTRAQLQIHICVLLWGFTAILGKLITLAALPLVWWRMLIVSAVLALLPRVWRELRAIALVSGGVPQEMRVGVAVGALSALLVAIFGSLNKRLVAHGEPLTVTAIELASGTVVLTLLAGVMPYLFAPFAGTLLELPGPRDAMLLLVLAIACTLLPFALSLVALRHMSAFAAQLAVNLEPVYAIVLAIVLLGEQRELTPLFYLGVLIILGAVFLHPLVLAKRGSVAAQPEHPEVLGTAEAKQVIN